MKTVRLLVMSLLMSLLIPTVAHAVSWGLGASVDSDDSLIYFPINVTEELRLEPFLGVFESETDVDGFGEAEFESKTLGIGGFWRAWDMDRAHGYLGGRIASVDSESEGTGAFAFSADQDGFRVEPTLGGEYFLSDHFSVGIEAFYYYSKQEGESGGDDFEFKNSGTDARVIVRFFFK